MSVDPGGTQRVPESEPPGDRGLAFYMRPDRRAK
jgi:hypothetical protein